MPCTESKEGGDVPRSPSITTPTKTSSNSRAGYGDPQSEETETEEEECEEECDKGQKKPLRNYTGWLEYAEQETLVTGPEATLEKADIDNQILQRMTKFMTDSRLFKTPGHKPKKTDIHLWKLSSKEYYSKQSDKHIKTYVFTSDQRLIAATSRQSAE